MPTTPQMPQDNTVELNVESFRRQRVLCYRGRWVARKDVIRYVANVGSGVHTGSENEEEFKLLSLVRNSARLRRDDPGTGVHMDFLPNGIDVDKGTFQHTPNAIDPVMIELLAAATFLVKSPYIDELEKYLQEEFAT